MRDEKRAIVGIRVSPDSPDLVLVQETWSVIDGELRAVGGPSETKLTLPVRRATLTISTNGERGDSTALVTTVRNTGFQLFEVDRVRFEVSKTCSAGAALSQTARLPDFRMSQPAQTPYQLPNESRNWVLPLAEAGMGLGALAEADTNDFRIAVYVGGEILAALSGSVVQPQLTTAIGRYRPQWGLEMSGPMRGKVALLDDEDREQIVRAVHELQAAPAGEWPTRADLTPLDDRLAFLTVAPGYKLLLTRDPLGTLRLLDVLRSSGASTEVAAGVAG